MSEVPAALSRLDEIERTSFIAHETIYELRSVLVGRHLATPMTDALLAESARITLDEIPAITASLRRLGTRWHEQRVLAPETADETAADLDRELARIQSSVQGWLDRQAAIGAELRAALPPRGR